MYATRYQSRLVLAPTLPRLFEKLLCIRREGVMSEAAYLVADMAQTITYEAIRFPVTEEAALAWLRRAVDWAQKCGLTSLVREVQTCIFRIEIQEETFTFDADILELRPEQIVEVGRVLA